ncbi:MAG: FeoA family protein [Candidatus Thermoplasmatota archaeon]|nr:FeoA family protein [Candidatus Thermoplasmatota archaeon]
MNPIYIPKNKRPLSTVKDGERVVIRDIAGGRSVNLRLSELGLGVGSKVTVLQNAGGPVIVFYGDSRMALGRGVASKMIVE